MSIDELAKVVKNIEKKLVSRIVILEETVKRERTERGEYISVEVASKILRITVQGVHYRIKHTLGFEENKDWVKYKGHKMISVDSIYKLKSQKEVA